MATYFYSILLISHLLEDPEAPTVVLDRLDVTVVPESVTIAEGLPSPDPFRDVIRTEPAPNLESLIGDMPFFTTRNPTTPSLNTQQPNAEKKQDSIQDQEHDDSMNYSSLLDKILDLIPGMQTNNETATRGTFQISSETHADMSNRTADSTPEPSSSEKHSSGEAESDSKHEHGIFNHPNSVDSAPGVGLLKLAGCNIYGRMYRVGRIISELSGPCMECKCTEIGVQCRGLSC